MNFFDFSEALKMLKGGSKIARKGWNGSNMFCVLSPGASTLLPEQIWSEPLRKYVEGTEEKSIDFRPCLILKTAQDDAAYWVPSCSDILAYDWYEVI